MIVATNCFFLIISFAGHHINILILFFGYDKMIEHYNKIM